MPPEGVPAPAQQRWSRAGISEGAFEVRAGGVMVFIALKSAKTLRNAGRHDACARSQWVGRSPRSTMLLGKEGRWDW